MKKIPPQQFLRQQISFARVYLDALKVSEQSLEVNKFQENSQKLACIMALDKGFFEYLLHLVLISSQSPLINQAHPASFRDKDVLPRNLDEACKSLSRLGQQDYRLAELKVAAGRDDGELSRLAGWGKSVYYTPAQWQSAEAAVAEGSGAPAGANLIASSASTTENIQPHWTKIGSGDLERILVWSEELLSRHSSGDEEF